MEWPKEGKMCSTLYTFCLVFIIVADCQEGPWKKALFTNNEKFSNNCIRMNCFVRDSER